MKLKKSICIWAMLFIACAFSGCRIVDTYDMTEAGMVKVIMDVYYSEEELSGLTGNVEDFGKDNLVTLEDGKRYYKNSDSETVSVRDLNSKIEGTVINQDMVYLPVRTVEEQEALEAQNSSLDYNAIREALDLRVVFIFPEEVVETNGILSEDKQTVTFVTGTPVDKAFYAYTAAGKKKLEADTSAPVISGVKPNVYYKSSVLKKLVITDDTGIANVTVNGRKVEKDTDGNWTFPYGGKFNQGKNTIVATDIRGNATTFTLMLDDKAPKIKELKNNSVKKAKAKKVVFYVQDKNSDLKRITVSKNSKKFKVVPKSNIKKVKSGKYKGYYKVTLTCKKSCKLSVRAYDKCGNVTSVKNVKVKVK